MDKRHQQYRKISKIGEGTYSKVYSGENVQTGELVALKDINLTHDDGAPSTALREIAFLKKMSRHPHILTLIDVLHPSEDSLTLVFEQLSLDLRQFLDKYHPDGMPLPLVKSFLRQLLVGLQVCHQNFIIHRDVKPQNILIDLKTGIVKLGDFGLARAFAIPVTGFSPEVVTLWYRPPEILLSNTQYSSSVDMWSTGCILVEMLTGKPPFQGRNSQDQLRCIFRQVGYPDPADIGELLAKSPHLEKDVPKKGACRPPSEPLFGSFDATTCDLLQKFLQHSPTRRCTASQALEHPFFRS